MFVAAQLGLIRNPAEKVQATREKFSATTNHDAYEADFSMSKKSQKSQIVVASSFGPAVTSVETLPLTNAWQGDTRSRLRV